MNGEWYLIHSGNTFCPFCLRLTLYHPNLFNEINNLQSVSNFIFVHTNKVFSVTYTIHRKNYNFLETHSFHH